jgi:PAS domain-containing protein
VAATKSIQLILARQLASCVAMPILLFDAQGNLVYYNEPAEDILRRRFDETGEISADELLELLEGEDERRNPIPPEERPTRITRRERRAVTRTVWIRVGDTQWRHLQATAVPLIGDCDEMLGIMHFFWEI